MKGFSSLRNHQIFDCNSRSIGISLLAILLLLINTNLFAQEEIKNIFHNSIYIEGGGLAGGGSLNYERILVEKPKWKFAATIGYGTYRLKDFTNSFNPDIILPIAVKGLFGNIHNLELGVGQTITNIAEADPTTLELNRNTHLNANFIVGYRYQKNDGRLILRCTYTPIIEFYKNFRHWGGASVGFAF